MRVLTLFPLFRTFGARAKMKTTAINAVKPRYAYCSNEDGIIGTSDIQYGKACMFQYQAKINQRRKSVINNNLFLIWNIGNLWIQYPKV